MTVPAVLAGLAVAVALALPSAEAARLDSVLPRRRTGVRRLPSLDGLRASRPVLPALAAAAGLLVVGPALAVVACAGAVALLSALSARSRAAEATRERAGALEACAVLASELRAGRSPGQGLDAAVSVAAGPFRDRLAGAAAASRFGGDPAAVLATATPGPATCVPEVCAGLAACWQVCSGTGSGLAASVDRLEEGLRAAEAARRAVEAELAGPRATASMLALLPLAGVGLAAALGARPVHVLLQTQVGGVCLVAGVALDLAGLAWTRRIARSAGG
ncbi:MAG: hypothetical protein JWN17_1308 [Frankiales bacterium]|nr:hypothetical protein [Frankiales bacterium]